MIRPKSDPVLAALRVRTTARVRTRTVCLQALATILSAQLALPLAAVADDAACIGALHKNAGKIANAWAKHIGKCLKDKGEAPTVEDCIEFDGGKKIAKAYTKLFDQAVGGVKDKCGGVAPAVGYAGAVVAGDAAATGTVDVAHRLFGQPVDDTDPGADKVLQKCRQSLWKETSKLAKAAHKQVTACITSALKGGADDEATLAQACFAGPGIPDPDGKLAAKGQKLVEKMAKKGCADDESMRRAGVALSTPVGSRATAIEYGLIASLIAIAIIVAVAALGTSVATTYGPVAMGAPGYWAGLYHSDFSDDRAINNSKVYGFRGHLFEANSGAPHRACTNPNGALTCSNLGVTTVDGVAVGYGPIDGDPATDALCVGPTDARVCINNFDDSFACTRRTDAFADNDVAVGVFPFDDDFDADAVVARATGALYCENDDGTFPSCTAILGSGGDTRGVALGDVDRNDTLDAALAVSGGPDRICRVVDPGSGFEWSCSDFDASSLDTRAVALGDLDRDGDVDAVFAVHSGPNRFCLNDGDGTTWTCGNVSADVAATVDVGVGDMDNDSNTDVVFANDGAENRLCDNDGTGVFSCADVSDDVAAHRAVSVGETNGDGFRDLVFAVSGGPNRQCAKERVTGVFVCADIAGGAATDTRDVALIGRFIPPATPVAPSGR